MVVLRYALGRIEGYQLKSEVFHQGKPAIKSVPEDL